MLDINSTLEQITHKESLLEGTDRYYIVVHTEEEKKREEQKERRRE